MIDINKSLDLVKLKFYNEWLYSAYQNPGVDETFHKGLTNDFVKSYVDPLNLPKHSNILDMGCGPGYFLDAMKNRGYTNLTGITISKEDAKFCQNNGHNIKMHDFSFLPQRDGFTDESVDFIFFRHGIEQSPYPIFTLMEYNRLLKFKGKIYIETPAPECERGHEYHPNHYSVMGISQIKALLKRTGFEPDQFNTVEFDLNMPEGDADEVKTYKEKYYCILATKVRSIDVK